MTEEELVDEVAAAMMCNGDRFERAWEVASERIRDKWRRHAEHALARIRELRDKQHRERST